MFAEVWRIGTRRPTQNVAVCAVIGLDNIACQDIVPRAELVLLVNHLRWQRSIRLNRVSFVLTQFCSMITMFASLAIESCIGATQHMQLVAHGVTYGSV